MSRNSPATRALYRIGRLLGAIGLLEAAPASVRNAGKRVRARRALVTA